MQARNRYESIDLAQTAFTVFHGVLGLPVSWDASSSKVAWEAAAVRAIQVVDLADGDDAREVSARGLAATMYHHFCNSEGLEEESFDRLLPAQRLAWEVAGRHLANLIDSDGSLVMNDHEGKWGEWFEKRLARSSQSGVV